MGIVIVLAIVIFTLAVLGVIAWAIFFDYREGEVRLPRTVAKRLPERKQRERPTEKKARIKLPERKVRKKEEPLEGAIPRVAPEEKPARSVEFGLRNKKKVPDTVELSSLEFMLEDESETEPRKPPGGPA